jgi:hypothetical protein
MFGWLKRKKDGQSFIPEIPTGVSEHELEKGANDVVEDVVVEPLEDLGEGVMEVCEICLMPFRVAADAISGLARHICPSCRMAIEKVPENLQLKSNDWQPHQISEQKVSTLQKDAREGKHIGAENLGDIVFTNEIKRHSPERAREIAYGVIGIQARQTGHTRGNPTSHVRTL